MLLGHRPVDNLTGEEMTETLPSRERQCFDPTRVACCYFKQKERSPSADGVNQVRGQGILVQLCHHEEPRVPSLAVITSHQLLPSISSARQWVIGFHLRGAQRKEFPLADYINQQELQLITCCGEQDCLWSNHQEHLESKCPMHSDFTVLLLGESFSNDILSMFGQALCIFSLSDCMDLQSAQKVLQGAQRVNVYYRTMETVLQSPFDIQAPPRVDSAHLLSTQVDWYHNHYTTFSYKPATMPLLVTGAPIIYCETNTGKPWLLGMHVYLASQSVQYGISFSHILELLQCHLEQEHPVHNSE